MIFAGLSLAHLAAIFGAAGFVVAVLYVLKLRRRIALVPYSPLWERILRDRDAASLFSKLKRLLSLLLQLLLLALLVLALGDPRAAATLVQGRTMVVLIDASASMQATDVSPSRLADAKAHAKALVRGMGGADRMLIAQMDAAVTPLGPMTGDPAALEREIDAVQATDARADFARALRFATDVLRGTRDGEIVVVSDGALGAAADAYGPVHLGGAKLSTINVGTSADNVGITQFSVRRYPLDKSRYEVMLELTNTSPEPADVELQLVGDGAPVDVTRLHLRPGERLPRFYPELSGASRTLEAKLLRTDGVHDDLPVDDHAYALLPERRRARVLVVTEGNTYLEAALLLDEYLDVTDVAPRGYADAIERGRWDAVIFDGVTPATMPRADALYLDPRGPGAPVKVGRSLDSPGFDKVDRKDPTMRFLALEDVNVSAGHALMPAPGDRVVGASDGGMSPLLVTGVRGGYKFVALGFDVRDSDLPLRTAWPLFVVNCIEWFSDDDAEVLSGLRTGEVWHIPVASGVSDATLRLPSGATQSIPVHEGRAVVLGEHAGFYDLTAGGRTTRFAANLLDVDESTIAPQKHLVVDGRGSLAVAGFRAGARRELWIYLLFAVAALTAAEWATYHRRVTV